MLNTSNFSTKAVNILVALFFLASISCLIGCASSKTVKLQQKIRAMSDGELLSYYHGINDRIKYIGHDVQRDEHTYGIQPSHNIYNTPFSIGGEGYQLYQAKKMTLKELHRRKINF